MHKNIKKVERVRKLRVQGKSFREIARLLRADVRSVYRWYTYGLEKTDEEIFEGARTVEKKKRNARSKVFRALQNGKLEQKSCVKCGSKKTEAHHPNHSYPLKVIWLCKKHHGEVERGVLTVDK